MEAIRQYLKVNGRILEVILPDDFIADEVEVIILPSGKFSGAAAEWQMQQVKERSEEYLKNPAIAEDFEKAMKDIEDGL